MISKNDFPKWLPFYDDAIKKVENTAFFCEKWGKNVFYLNNNCIRFLNNFFCYDLPKGC